MTDDGSSWEDPLVRCYACNQLVHRAYVSLYGGCGKCGNRRFRNVTGLSDAELDQIKADTYPLGRTEDGRPFMVSEAFKADWEPADEQPGIDQ